MDDVAALRLEAARWESIAVKATTQVGQLNTLNGGLQRKVRELEAEIERLRKGEQPK